MKKQLQYCLMVFLLAVSGIGDANEDNLLMVRTEQAFDIAMEKIQRLIKEYGYKVAHTQRCDGGLHDFGYETDYYRVIFFGKHEEVRQLSNNHPELVPFLPLKLLLFAENDETVIVSLNPDTLAHYFDNPEIKQQLKRWYNDISGIFSEMRTQNL